MRGLAAAARMWQQCFEVCGSNTVRTCQRRSWSELGLLWEATSLSAFGAVPPWQRGRGERLTDLPPLPPCWLVLCKPSFGIPTPELFALADTRQYLRRPDIEGMHLALRQGYLEGIAAKLCNVFEELLPPQYNEVFVIKERLLTLGALNASMSGSGPTVFGIFRSREAAERAAQALEREYTKTYLAEPVGKFQV